METPGAAGMGLDTDASNKLVDRVETGSHNRWQYAVLVSFSGRLDTTNTSE